MNPKNPEEPPKPMFPKVAEALGVPADTFQWPFPRKPLGKAPGKGPSKGHAKGGVKGHSPGRSHSKHKKPSYEGGFG